MFGQRSHAIELMDDLSCSGEAVHQTLKELDYINRRLGGNSVTLTGISKLAGLLGSGTGEKVISVCDLGCGGGAMLLMLSRHFKRLGIRMSGLGIDANPEIIDFARKHCQHDPALSFEVMNILSPDFKLKKFDLVTATLFFHHFTSDQLVHLLKDIYHQASVGIVINDLHRHWLAYYSIKVLTTILSKSLMVKNDAPLSVLRGFTRMELMDILKKAGITQYTIRWKWAFRWQVVIATRRSGEQKIKW